MIATDCEIKRAWEELLDGIECIFRQQSMSRQQFIKLYSDTYTICSSTQHTVAAIRQAGTNVDRPSCDLLTRSRRSHIIRNPAQRARRKASYLQENYLERSSSPEDSVETVPDNNSLLCSALYDSIKTLLCDKVKNSIATTCLHLKGEELLVTYVNQWQNYQLSASVLSGVCAYIDRHWAKREKSAKLENLPTVYGLAANAWWTEVASRVQPEITRTCLENINRLRQGQLTDTYLISNVVSCLVEMDYVNTDKDKQRLEIYKENFERPFIEATEAFYRNESKMYLKKNEAAQYLSQVYTRLQDEDENATKFLHESSRELLIATVEKAFVIEHLDYLYDEFQTLLKQNASQEMGKIFDLFKNHPKNLSDLKEMFEVHIHNVGSAMLKSFTDASQDPSYYVNCILTLHREFSTVLSAAFGNAPEFCTALDKAFGKFINGSGKTAGGCRCAEILAKYADQIMRKSTRGATEDIETDQVLSRIMVVFSYLDDKDVFQKFYGRLLAKRLVSQSSASDDNEMLMISKLKQSCGYEFTAKLQRMFQDISLSKDISDRFRRKCADDNFSLPPIDFSVMVLSAGSWPFSPQQNYIIPEEVQPWCDRFGEFYANEHTGRKLTWLLNQSRVELVANCFKRKYTFQTSVYQANILLLFNDRDCVSFEEIMERFKLDANLAKSIILILLKSRLLIASSEIGEAEKIPPSTSFRLYADYKNKKVRVNINVPMRCEQKIESEQTHRNVAEDRSILIQAAIVRLMKSRKEMDHTQLITEAIAQVSTRFKPKINDIKKCIDVLIEKEYLTRDESRREIYRYLA